MGLRCLSIHTANATNIITYVSIYHILWQSKPFWPYHTCRPNQTKQKIQRRHVRQFVLVSFVFARRSEKIYESSWSCEAVSDHCLVSSPEKFLGGVDDFPGSLPQYLMSLLFFGCKCCTFFECYREKESLETGMLAPPRPREEWLPRTRKFSRLPSPAPPQNFLFALDLNWTLIWHCFI